VRFRPGFPQEKDFHFSAKNFEFGGFFKILVKSTVVLLTSINKFFPDYPKNWPFKATDDFIVNNEM
jgi:hypothetical protein